MLNTSRVETPGRATESESAEVAERPMDQSRARPTRGDVTSSADRIRRAAANLFRTDGYRATSMRKLAAHAGLTAGSLYNHFPSKQALLFDILLTAHTSALERLQCVLATEGDPVELLRRAVRGHVLFHLEDQAAIAVVYRDIAYLGAEEHATIMDLRRAYERDLVGLLTRGARAGVFDLDDAPLAAIAIISMGIRVAAWFKPTGRLSADQVADSYAAYAVRLVGGAESGTRVKGPAATGRTSVGDPARGSEPRARPRVEGNIGTGPVSTEDGE